MRGLVPDPPLSMGLIRSEDFSVMGARHSSKIKDFLIISSISILVFFSSASSYAAEAVFIPPDISYSQNIQLHPRTPVAPTKGIARRGPAVAQQHIMVKLSPDMEISSFLKQARGLGMRKLKRIQNTNWYSMAIPAHTQAMWKRVGFK